MLVGFRYVTVTNLLIQLNDGQVEICVLVFSPDIIAFLCVDYIDVVCFDCSLWFCIKRADGCCE